MSEASCACLQVKYDPKELASGTYRAPWLDEREPEGGDE